MADVRQIALLIDADNTQPQKMHAVVEMLSQRGQINVRRAYANWQKEALKSWSSVLETHAISQIQQADFVTGKNASDIALAIAAIDLLHKDRYGTFAIVSSDSDFTPLATHLREAGVQVIIFGKQQAVQAYRNSCHEFIFLEELEPISAKEKEAAEAAANPAQPAPAATLPNKQELYELLRLFAKEHGEAEGYASTCAVANHLRTLYPKFKIKGYGASSMTVFCRKHDKLYEVKKVGEGVNVTAYYRSIRPESPEPEAEAKPAAKPATRARAPRHDIPADSLHRALGAYAETHANNLGYTYAPAAATYITGLYPTEHKLSYGGYEKLLTFLEAHRTRYGVMKIPQGVACGIFYRCIGENHATPRTPELPGLELGSAQ